MIQVENMGKRFRGKWVFEDLNLRMEPEKIHVLCGANGIGKSTLLQILGGLLEADTGQVVRASTSSSFVFQNYGSSLFPWKSNLKNLLFAAGLQKVGEGEIQRRLQLLEVPEKLQGQNYPYQLSGGQRQLLAFYRALLTLPDILFIDEPFAALDIDHDFRLRALLKDYRAKHNATIVMILHGIDEILDLAEVVWVLGKDASNRTQLRRLEGIINRGTLLEGMGLCA